MTNKKALFNIKGMTRDLAVSKFSPQFAYENKNIRIIATDSNDTLALVNEKGNTKVSYPITGTPIGKAEFPDSLILFTTTGETSEETKSKTLSTSEALTVRQYATYDDAIEDVGGVALPYHYFVGRALYSYSDPGYYLGYTANGIRKVVTPPTGGIFVVTDNSRTRTVTLICVSEITEGQTIFLNKLTYTITNIGEPDYIYKFNFDDSDNLEGNILFHGRLGFDTKNPIESIAIYENEELQKVYWVDGKNQPRVINIKGDTSAWAGQNDSFDFIRKLSFNEEPSVSRLPMGNGIFAPGTIQYCLTYFDKYGQQTNIFYTSPLYYTSYNDRGASPDDTVSNCFYIEVINPDTKFDYVRVYSILRTSVNATPQVRKVIDLSIPEDGSFVKYVDNGTSGSTIDPTELLYIGGEQIIAGTLAQKDNTLFLGDITYNKKAILETGILDDVEDATIDFSIKQVVGAKSSGYYSYKCQLPESSKLITTYKSGETYRLGIQFQDTLGNWSTPIFIKDVEIPLTEAPKISGYDRDIYQVTVPVATITLSSSTKTNLLALGYVNARPVVVFPTISDRSVICQGVLCPTLYNAEDRFSGLYSSVASWFFRPNAPYSTYYDIANATVGWNPDEVKTKVMSNYMDSVSGVNTSDTCNYGKWAEFRHNKPIPGNLKANAEIQCISNPPDPFLGVTNGTYTEETAPNSWIQENRECYYVDQSVVTLNSPEIEFDSETSSLDLSGVKLRIVGYIPLDSQISDIDIQSSTVPLNYVKGSTSYDDIAPGFYKEKASYEYHTSGGYGWKSALSGMYWLDELYGSNVDNINKYNVGFVVYPWHRNGSLNNTRYVDDNGYMSAKLSHKKMSILRYSTIPVRLSTPWEAYDENNSNINTGISGAIIFNDTENQFITIPEPKYSNMGKLNYGGNIDKILTFHTEEKAREFDSDLDIPVGTGDGKTNTTSSFYPIAVTSTHTVLSPDSDDETINFRTSASHWLFISRYYPLRRIKNEGGTLSVVKYCTDGVTACSADPVSIKYKSTPHAVIALNYTTGRKQRILPTHNSTNTLEGAGSVIDSWECCPEVFNNSLFWDKNYNDSDKKITGASQDSITLTGDDIPTTGYLWLGELYRDDVENRFGGDTAEAIENNQWLPAGEPVSLYDTEDNTIAIAFTEGDTYFQRYDCLKTYPYTMEDQNSVVDILSFMVETHVNIDGRYDRNRGQTSNLYMSPQNFNLLNPVYSQRNNFFNYRGENPNKLILNKFPNTVTWTKTKTLGEEIDTWTNITLASTLDLDGDKGPVRALRNLNNSLIAFQDNGISQILYNENVQIASTTGVPIEIANSGKVSGKRYISNHIGCTNKWSICSTPAGLYFLDSLRKDFYLFNGELNNLSDSLGFHSWMVNTFKDNSIWNPEDFNSCITLYDRINGDVLITTKDTALAFSEPLQQFSSFYDYGDTPTFTTIKDKGIAIHKEYNSDTYYPYLHREGKYNSFFGEDKPFWTTVIVNSESTFDKIFNTLEYRADGFTENSEGKYEDYDKGYNFNLLKTWNEYQEGQSNLRDVRYKPSNLKKKFRIWRANIPRNTENKGGDSSHNYTRDRMRNPWLYLQLKMQGDNITNDEEHPDHKVVLHDLVVDYFE